MPTGNKRIDWQKHRIYAADWFLVDMRPRPLLRSIDAVQSWMNRITRSKWFKTHFGHIESVEIHNSPDKAYAYAKWKVIEISRAMRQKTIILHELAHICNDARKNHRADHGRHFAGIFLALVRQYMGEKDYSLVKTAFDKFGVKYTMFGSDPKG